MSDEYRLVFRGEVAQGQHPAVVRKRIAAVMKVDDKKAALLFSGKTVIIRKAADAQTAARYQAAFKKAGARLRVLPVEQAAADRPETASGPTLSESATGPSAGAPAAADEGRLKVLPVGTDVLKPDEREVIEPADIDTSQLKVQGAVFDASVEETQGPTGPDVGHLSLAELGALLGTPAEEIVVAEIDVEFDLAEVGAILGETGIEVEVPEVPEVDFDLAPPGVTLVTSTAPPAPPAPDTSHITLEELPDDAPENNNET
ncbi:MAG: hypothetical protein AAF513_02040 [Pseudomonadota bacterium]